MNDTKDNVGSYHYKKEVIVISELEHTKGPWILSRGKKGSYIHLSGIGWTKFAKVIVRMTYSNDDDKIGHANVKLISACPELLEACLAVIEGNIAAKQMCEIAVQKAIGK